MIIGLTGYARSGKDEVANILCTEYEFTRIAFADILRDFLLAVNPTIYVDRPRELSDIIHEFGWEGYKDTVYADKIRGLLQRTGSEAGRSLIGENVWIDATLSGLAPDRNYVVSDVRYVNEADSIVKLGGVIVRIDRDGVGPKTVDGKVHSSESDVDKIRYNSIILNNGTLKDLNQKTISFMENH